MGESFSPMRVFRSVIVCAALVCVTTSNVVLAWEGTRVQDLWAEYRNIFTSGNRNAASHLWSAFLIDRAHSMTLERFNSLNEGYCAVSGSPVTPMQHTRYRMTLDTVTGERVTGIVYYCCWPCVCDTQDFIKIDTKTIVTAEGSSVHRFMVIGNPCQNAAQIPYEAPEVRCGPGGELLGAPMSDNGFVILAKFFDDDGKDAQDDTTFAEHCEYRKQMNYNSGMGDIFRKVAGITRIRPAPPTSKLTGRPSNDSSNKGPNSSDL